MLTRRAQPRRPFRVMLLVVAAGAGFWGCQSILGIEELSESPRPPSGAMGAMGGQGGSAGDVGSGGFDASQAGAANPGDPGDRDGMPPGGGGAAGMDAVSDAGIDAAPAGALTVAGRVINFYRRPTPGLRVTIGQQEALTDANGEFTIAGVAPPYDVSLVVSISQSDFVRRDYAYSYQGLTRPDPTLQVYDGLPGRGSVLSLSVSNASSFDDPNRRLIFAFSSPDGYYSAAGINFETATLSPGWSGSEATAGNAHALLVLRSSSATGAPPVAYEAYETAPLALRDEVDSSLSLDMSADTIPQVNLTGSVDSGLPGSHTQLISTRFADGTVLPLVAEQSSQATFSYLVPALAGSSLIVASSAGPPGYRVAHADAVPLSADQNVALTLPQAVVPSAPGNGSEVRPGTPFSWSTLGQTAQVFVWHLESDRYFEGIYVITSRSEIEFPSVPGYSMTLATPADDFAFHWSVETHGDYPNVDAAAGPDGLYDAFALEVNVPTGPSRGSRGYYTNSESRTVDVAAQ